MKTRRRCSGFLWGFAFLPVVMGGCGPGDTGGLEAADSWARAMVRGDASGGNSAVYLTLRNRGRVADTLLGGSSPVASRVEIHESILEGDVMRMREVGPLAIGPGDSVTLQPGGLHIMLVGLRESLVAGDSISLTLRFANQGAVSLRIPVRGMGPGGM